MSEQTMADALLTLWKAKAPASTYVLAANSTARGDLSVFGENRYGVAIMPGPFTNADGAFSRQHDRVWTFDVYVGARYDDQPEVILDVMTVSQALIDTTDEWPRLNATAGVLNARVISGDTPVLGALISDPDGPTYVVRTIRVQVEENVSITESE